MAKKILIADDEPAIIRVLSSRLRAAGYEVSVAPDGVYAVTKAHSEKPDLIILDIKMPAGTGFTVFQNLKSSAETETIPIIFITAFATDEAKEEALAMGAADFIPKPFEAEDLIARIKNILGE